MPNIIEVIEHQIDAGRRGARFTFEGATTSIREIRRNALRYASQFSVGERVMIALPKGFDFVEAFLGCLYAGAIAVPVAVPGSNRGTDAFRNVLADCDANACITAERTREILRSAHIGDVNIATPAELASNEPLSPGRHRDGTIAFLQYTSGSTGDPKGVIVTHENLIANSAMIKECFGNTVESVSVCWLPAFHDMGLVDGIIQPIYSGFHSVMLSPTRFLQRPRCWLQAMSEHRATYSGGPNFAFDLCIDRVLDGDLDGIDLTDLRALYNGSEKVRTSTMRRFTERFAKVGFASQKFVSCYGLAEATLAVSATRLDEAPRSIDLDGTSYVSCGRPLDGVEITIVDPLTETPVDGEAVGEIWLSGKNISPGYYNRGDDACVERHGKKFLRTGDLASISGGELFVTGRIKDVIVLNGKNHSPADIEAIVVESHPGLQVNGSAAFSVEVDDRERLVIVAEVKRSFMKVDVQRVVSSIMVSLARAGLAPFDVVLIAPNTLPKTTSGKIARSRSRHLWKTKMLRRFGETRAALESVT